ncbi:MAG TPA: DUF1343 domain-containing protein [Flavobacteriia bacterium]|nr:DUF1343 domain-containing protein [Flavobacteriia bacterium]
MLLNIRFKSTYFFSFILFILLVSCSQKGITSVKPKKKSIKKNKIITGANQTELYLPIIKNKNFAVVANQTSVIKNNGKNIHLVDFLKQKFPNKIKKVFAPEHGFRGNADAGEHILNGMDTKTGLPIISLYGKNKKPTNEQIKDLDLIIFDIQDVGVRFYTYITTLHYVMEACAENKIPLIILDRPNPNAYYIDGPVLEKEQQSFVGMHPIPTVYGMTIGEYAKMINGEKWLENNVKCKLTIIPIKNYSHQSKYDLPIKPSPNLPNAKAINLYPSLAFFEGTTVSCGRGTNKQFQLFGSPFLPKEKYKFSFIPKPNFGAKHPKHEGKICYGKNLENSPFITKLNLKWLIDAYQNTTDKKTFFNSFFKKLAGTKKLQQQIIDNLSEDQIRESWKSNLENFKKIRSNYLLYK